MNKSFYISIQSMNLAHYLGRGIIAPSKYIENKNADIQDRFKNYLLLSSTKFTKDTNCAIEIVLNEEEEAPKKISEHFYLYDMPLPISRIKTIFFTNEEQKVNTNFNITSGSAFIPERLLKLSQEESIETEELDNINLQSFGNNWNEYLKRYDQIMGGFSIMKISKDSFQNYPTHYFSALGNINSLFSNILAQQSVQIENTFQFAFADEGRFKNFHNTIYSEIDYNVVQRYAENDNISLEIKNGLVQIDKIAENTQTYLVAILDSYGKGKRKQVDSFISDLISGKFNAKRKEGLSLTFGLNKGYTAFRNKYKTANFEVDIKFHLDNKLDYYIIESIYQNVFNSFKNISSFKYIDNLFFEVKKEVNKNTSYNTYLMIDETIIWKPKVISLSERFLNKILQKVSSLFTAFIEVKKNELGTLFWEDIEQFKTEIENEYKAELEQNKALIEQLNNIISEKNTTINQLNQQITENIKPKLENLENQAETKNNYQQNPKLDLVQENNGSLFSDDTLISRELELKNLPEEKLKSIAKQYKITKRKKDSIISEIILKESKK